MKKFSLFKKQRTKKQILLSLVFLLIIIGAWFFPLLGYFIPLCMVVGIGIGFTKGRKWCDWFCPRGSFYDATIVHISPGKKIPLLFKKYPLRTGMIIFLMTMMTIQIINRWPDPFAIGMFFVMLLTITTIAGIILALFYQQRIWCYICPIGTMINWTGGLKYPLVIDSDLCTKCEVCYKVCPMQIAPYNFTGNGKEIVKDRDCLKCGSCVEACPTSALKLGGL